MCANSLSISVDELFETHSIAEIDQIQKKLLEDVEKKREELRTMVGERYRDLLKAADTIEKMKDTSTSVVTQIGEIILHCKNLHEKQLIGFKMNDLNDLQSSSSLMNKELNMYFSTVIQIKLLTSLPEMIWSNIDDKQYFLATQLFIFSRHISTGLQLNIDNNYIKYFPVAKKQWEILKPLYLILKQVSTFALEKEIVTVELACDCLLSIFLLEKSSLEEILNIFLHLRTKAYLATLCSSDKKRRVRDRILASLQVLNSTINLIDTCFIGKNNVNNLNDGQIKGLIFEELEKLCNDSGRPTIELMNLDDTDLTHILPDITLKFKPSFPSLTLSIETIKRKVENWYLSISNVANNQLKSLFDLITSMKTLQEIQKQSFEIEKLLLNDKLNVTTSINFYNNLYKPLLNGRTREIIHQYWKNCIEITCSEIENILKLNEENKLNNDNDKKLWLDELNDLPISLKLALNQDKKQNKLLMKTKGYNNEIIKICTQFDERLKSILIDLDFILKENLYKFDEKQNLIEYLRKISEENSKNFIEIIKVKYTDNNILIIDCIIIARILSALIELCPNFKLCLTYAYNIEDNWNTVLLQDKNLNTVWYDICKLFDDESYEFWKKFCNKFHEENPIEKQLNNIQKIDYQLILHDFLNWDTISIEEQDEHGNPLKSIIKIPSQIRISLQLYLFELIKLLDNYVPQTLPRKILKYFNTILLKNLLNNYKNLLELYNNNNNNNSENSNQLLKNQNIALQLYFDLKFLQLFFVKHDDKQEQEQFNKLLIILKNHIDPFDYELFHNHINMNVKKFIIKMQHQFGVIFPNLENIKIIFGGNSNDIKQLLINHDKDPNVLYISCNGSTSTWFSLLPIATLNQRTSMEIEKSVAEAKQVKKSTTTTSNPTPITTTATTSGKQQSLASQQTAQTYASNVKSGAAAFFGAMSQDWFR